MPRISFILTRVSDLPSTGTGKGISLTLLCEHAFFTPQPPYISVFAEIFRFLLPLRVDLTDLSFFFDRTDLYAIYVLTDIPNGILPFRTVLFFYVLGLKKKANGTNVT